MEGVSCRVGSPEPTPPDSGAHNRRLATPFPTTLSHSGRHTRASLALFGQSRFARRPRFQTAIRVHQDARTAQPGLVRGAIGGSDGMGNER